jgi:small subunit ribosomal protein S1
VVAVGSSIEAKFMGVDRKNRIVNLSVKAKDQADEKEAIDKVNQQEEVTFTNAFADAFKAAKND